MGVTKEVIEWGGWPNCVRLQNGLIEVVVTTDVGPRIIHAGLCGGRNLLKVFEKDLGWSGDSQWRCYGGHRLWHAPEHVVRTYVPDNQPVPYRWDGTSLYVGGIPDGALVARDLVITMDSGRPRLRVEHCLRNHHVFGVRLAPWALTVMAAGATGIVPQAPHVPHGVELLPARRLALWPYTKMADPRITWGRRFIRVRQDPQRPEPLKIGISHCPWQGALLDGFLLLKRADLIPNAEYPDLGVNVELFTNGQMLELESLGPLATLESQQDTLHVEEWYLARADGEAVGDDDALAELLAPHLAAAGVADESGGVARLS